MRRIVQPSLARFLLIALLCLTLPLKGLAAAGMGLCGGSANTVMAAHEHGEAHAAADPHAEHHGAQGQEDANPCSHCSPCCAALAPWVMPPALNLEPVPPGVTPFVRELRLDNPARGFERPPRTILD